MSSTSSIADRIARYAASLGYSAAHTGSKLSESAYVEVTLWDEADADAGVSLKIRVSDHDLPPSYAAPDIDVLATEARGFGVHWTAAVARLAREAGKPVPATVRGLMTRMERTAAAAEAARDAAEAQTRALRAAMADRDAQVAAMFPAEWAAAAAKGGKDGRERRRVLRRRYEAAQIKEG